MGKIGYYCVSAMFLAVAVRLTSLTYMIHFAVIFAKLH